jgi:hypothetical protein
MWISRAGVAVEFSTADGAIRATVGRLTRVFPINKDDAAVAWAVQKIQERAQMQSAERFVQGVAHGLLLSAWLLTCAWIGLSR